MTLTILTILIAAQLFDVQLLATEVRNEQAQKLPADPRLHVNGVVPRPVGVKQ